MTPGRQRDFNLNIYGTSRGKVMTRLTKLPSRPLMPTCKPAFRPTTSR